MRASLGTSSRHARVKVEVLRERDQVLTQVSLRLSPAGACGMSSHTPSGRTGIAVGCTPVYLTGSGIAVEPDAAGVDEFFLNPRPLVEDRKMFDRASDISLPLPWREGKRGGGFARSVSPPNLTSPRQKGGRICCAHAETPPWRGLADATRSAGGASLRTNPHTSWPARRSAVAVLNPMYPVAPVMKILMFLPPSLLRSLVAPKKRHEDL
jgi:hypothetical protein